MKCLQSISFEILSIVLNGKGDVIKNTYSLFLNVATSLSFSKEWIFIELGILTCVNVKVFFEYELVFWSSIGMLTYHNLIVQVFPNPPAASQS